MIVAVCAGGVCVWGVHPPSGWGLTALSLPLARDVTVPSQGCLPDSLLPCPGSPRGCRSLWRNTFLFTFWPPIVFSAKLIAYR